MNKYNNHRGTSICLLRSLSSTDATTVASTGSDTRERLHEGDVEARQGLHRALDASIITIIIVLLLIIIIITQHLLYITSLIQGVSGS